MPQGRILLKSISESKKLAQLSTDGARLLYTWIIAHLDVNGCFSADPDVINGKIFTRLKKSRKTIQSYLDDIESNGLIIRYNSNGDLFLIVPDFKDKQPYLQPHKEGKTTIPPPTPDILQNYSMPTLPQSKVKESKVKESNKKIKFREFVVLTQNEYDNLAERYSTKIAEDYIKRLDNYIGSKGKKYESHYRTILNWLDRDNIPELKQKQKKTDDENIKKLNKQREEYQEYIKNMDIGAVKRLWKEKPHIRWLIKEIRPNIEKEKDD